jgi:hypothetical protein
MRQAMFVAPVRLALGLASLVAAGAIAHSFGTALAEAAVGAVLTAFLLAAPGGRRRPARLQPPLAPRRTAEEPWWRALAVAMYPSTYGVAVLAGIALAFNRDLAAFLSGVLLGMGALALVHALSARP